MAALPDPSVHHPAGLGQAHVLVRDDVVLPTALLVEESGEVPLSLVVRRHPLGGRSDVRDVRRCGGAILDSSDDPAEHVSLIATCHPTTWPPETAMSTTASRCRWMPSRCTTSCVDWLRCVRQSDEGRMTWDWRPTMADQKHPRHYDEAFKRQIVQSCESGKPSREIGAEYDIARSTPRRWVQDIRDRRLEMEADVSGQAAPVFARRQA